MLRTAESGTQEMIWFMILYRIIVCCRKYNWAAAKKLCGLDAELLADMYKV